MPVQRILIRPPESRLGPAADAQRQELIARSPYQGRYEQMVDRESAYELLKQKATQATAQDLEDIEAKIAQQKSSTATRSRTRESPTEALLKSAARSIGSQLGRQLVRGVLGSLLGSRR